MPKKLTIAKITRPRLSGIFVRDRLSRLLDDARERPVTWVAAPAGSGKTTAVAGYLDARQIPCLWYQLDEGDGDLAGFFYYLGLAMKKIAPRHRKPLPLLTPEYLQGIPVFTRRYFENLFRRLTPPCCLVFDDYQDVPDDCGFHEMLAHALEVIPAGIRVIVLSRSEPPPQLARLRANSRLHLLGWEEIRFTRDEAVGLLEGQVRGSVSDSSLEALYEKSAGWAAGLVLLTARAMNVRSGPHQLGDLPPSEVFDYFAGEIFCKTDIPTQELLLKTAFLQRIDPATAGELTGNRLAGQILERLCRRHYFTERYADAYRYHPLFREFLLNQAKIRYSGQEVADIQREAARILERQGLVEEATALCLDAGDWSEAARLVNNQARNLVSQGRSVTLEGWIRTFPGQLLANTPWLLYWLGTCRVPFNPIEGQIHLQQAFDLFQTQKDLTGTLMTWSAAVNAVFVEWNDFTPLDGLIDWYYTQPDGVAFPSPEVEAEFASFMVCAMTFRRSSHPAIGEWVARALAVSRTCANPGLRFQACIMAYGSFMWVGDVANELLIRSEVQTMTCSQQVPPLLTIICKWFDALTLYRIADTPEEGLKAVAEAIDLSRQHGIHVHDNIIFGLGAYGAILKGDSTTAADFLARVQSTLRPERRNSYCQYHALVAWHHTVFGDLATARHHAELAVKLAVEVAPDSYPVPLCRIMLANILGEAKAYPQAEEQLELARELLAAIQSAILEFMLRMAEARLALQQGTTAAGIAALRRGMELGRSRNYMTLYYWWQPQVMAQLCARALEEGIEPEYARRLIGRNRLLPDETCFHVAGWPWQLRIYTLGRFEVMIGNEPVNFSGKRKIMELLKALVAFGGIAVRVERIIDLLWADAEGDDARNAFKMTLSRLRRFLPDDAILFHEGAFTLNRQLVWTDVLAFEKFHDRAVALWEERRPGTKESLAGAARLTEKALTLYRGAFLPADTLQPWAAVIRERLRNKILRLTTIAGQHHEDKGRWKSAAGFYRRALEADHLQEEFYYRLMVCHQQLGQHHEARAVYERCRAELFAGLGIDPSARTQKVLSTLAR